MCSITFYLNYFIIFPILTLSYCSIGFQLLIPPLAYTDKSHTNGEREGTSSVAIAVVLSVLAVLILAAIVGFIIMRRWKGKKKTRKMTMKERTALRAQNKDDLLRSEFNMDNIVSLFIWRCFRHSFLEQEGKSNWFIVRLD